jgi:hypothetical protein
MSTTDFPAANHHIPDTSACKVETIIHLRRFSAALTAAATG